MPPASEKKLAYNKQFYEKNKDKKQLIDTIKSILAGRKTQAKTLEKYGWSLDQVNRIRALNPDFRIALEETHGVKLEKLYRGKTALPPLSAVAVQVGPTPVPPPIPHYPQGLKETPAKETGTPITWEQTDTLWAGDIDKHEMGSNAVRKVMVDGKLVPAKYKKVI